MRRKKSFLQNHDRIAPIENQRYNILKSTGKSIRSDRIFRCTKPLLDKRKRSDAQAFESKLKSPSMHLFTEVPKVALFSLTIAALANKQERNLHKKQVMSDLK